MTTVDQTTEHVLGTERRETDNGPEFQPRCQCGWQVRAWINRDTATELGDDHLANAAQVQGPPFDVPDDLDDDPRLWTGESMEAPPNTCAEIAANLRDLADRIEKMHWNDPKPYLRVSWLPTHGDDPYQVCVARVETIAQALFGRSASMTQISSKHGSHRIEVSDSIGHVEIAVHATVTPPAEKSKDEELADLRTRLAEAERLLGERAIPAGVAMSAPTDPFAARPLDLHAADKAWMDHRWHHMPRVDAIRDLMLAGVLLRDAGAVLDATMLPSSGPLAMTA